MKLLLSSTLFLLIVILQDKLILFETASVNYVVPSGDETCCNEQYPCHTLDTYASKPANFVNNSIFYFLPGNHRINGSIMLINVQNLSLQGFTSDNQTKVVNILLGNHSIIWKGCLNIKISSITFQLINTFTFSIVFNQTRLVRLSDISIFGNGYSGCSLIMCLQSNINVSNSKFIGIQGWFGAAIVLWASNITFTDNNKFADNRAISGGGICLFKGTLVMTGTNLFTNNTSLGQVETECYYPWKVWEQTFYHDYYTNIYHGHGGAIFCDACNIAANGNLCFIKNAANNSGGALMVDSKGSATIQGTILFDGNSANVSGGAVMVTFSSTMKVCGNITFMSNSSTSFYGNMGIKQGGAIWSSFNTATIIFDQNTAHDGGAIYISMESNVTFMGIVRFYRNKATLGGAIVSNTQSIISFQGEVEFERNTAINGGAMAVFVGSNLNLVSTLNISFVLNSANNTGGAIYFEDNVCYNTSCTEYKPFPIKNISLYFVNNTAGSTGSTLYGELDKCKPCYKPSHESDFCNTGNYAEPIAAFMSTSTIVLQNNSVTNISATAERIRLCPEGKKIDWSTPVYTFNLHPGEHFYISLAAYGQTNVPVSTEFFIGIDPFNDIILSSASQTLGNSCSNISFQLHSTDVLVDVFQTIYLDNDPCQHGGEMYFHIFIEPCPIGFDLSEKEHKCVCDAYLQQFTPNCYIDNLSIERKRNTFWIYINDNVTIIIHKFRCPLDYCKENSVNVTLSKAYVQCDFNRDGILCGKCQKNFSLTFGSLHCVQCKNNSIALILLFAVIGIALVAGVHLLHLTVAVGTLNGLIFYANIIQANHQAFFPRATINFSTIFISWLNLDLGIEACFYDGMDIYAYSWMQFLFPLYVWFLNGCIILVSHYSPSFAKRLGTNPVAVFATFLLLSYSKIIKAIIFPLSWTYLTYYNSTTYAESQHTVWLYDANVDLFKEPKHIALGIFAIISLVVFVFPYMSLLLFGHWLQHYSNWLILLWLNRIKPFMDANYAPYKESTRYRIGLLLIARLGLLLTFAINANGSKSINILAVSSVSIALVAMKLRVYKCLYNDILESFFLLNLGIYSVATFYQSDSNQLIVSNISIGIAFFTFIGILLFHICLVLKSTSLWKMQLLPHIKRSQFLCTIFRTTPQEEEHDLSNINKNVGNIQSLQSLPTSSVVDVDLHCEPLLIPDD